MKVLITGGSGLLGSSVASLAKGHDILATYNKTKVDADFPMIPLDITSSEQVGAVFRDFKPDGVIHCAALTNVDYCEEHKGEALLINETGTRNIAQSCHENSAKMIYVSTDFVFDGERGMYTEEEEADPPNYYGVSKLNGEKAVIEECDDFAIARMSVLYGWNIKKRPNFVTWVINALKAGEQINIVSDQYASPTLADNGAEALLGILEKDKSGIFHVAGGKRINRLDFAKLIALVFGLDEGLISPITSDELEQKAYRPRDSSLDISKIERELGIKMLGAEEGLRKMKG